MKYSNNRLSLALAVTLGLCGCGAIARQPEPEVSGGVPGTASAASAKTPAQEARPADSAASGAVGSLPDAWAEDQRLVVNLLVFGVSYHTDRVGTRKHHVDNEFNPGLGLSYKIHNDDRRVISLETGIYKDSGSNLAKFMGPSYLIKLNDRWRLGVDLLAAQSRSYNHGRVFVSPIPHLAYDLGVVKLDAIFIPRIPPFNLYTTLGLYFTIPIHGM